MLLYKYLPLQWAERFVSDGEVLFRSLSYFRAVEHAARGDEAEGVHLDAPNHDVLLTTNTGIRVAGRYRYLRSVDQERVFAFCCSTVFDHSLFRAFEADACVVIHDPAPFFIKLRAAVARAQVAVKPGLRHAAVSYYRPEDKAVLDVTVPQNLPFLKRQEFSDQREYRAVYALPRGFKVLQRIVQPQFTFDEEIRVAKRTQQLIVVPRMQDVATVTRA